MDEYAAQTLYACRHRLELAESLGFGIHGKVRVAEGKVKAGKTALKAYYFPEPFLRERDAYLRLREAQVGKIRGLRVPQLLGFDDELRVIEMTIVSRPFLLDFGEAYLDEMPWFPEEIWAEWEADKREKFEDRWPIVQGVLSDLEDLGIHMLDVSPNNIAFLD